MAWTNEKHKTLCDQLDRLEERVNKKDLKKYKLHLLRGISRRMPELTVDCETCDELMQQVEVKMQEVDARSDDLEWEHLREMKPLMQQLLKHLEKEHEIVQPDHYQGLYMAMGVGIGVAMGTAMDNPAIGISLVIAIGLAIGSSKDSKAKEEDREI